MAWFSGKVSLGNFPDLAGAVNKLSESVKNIEKNFDTALGFEEKSDSGGEGLWPSASDRKALFDPVMAFMGHKSGETAFESLEKAGEENAVESPEKAGEKSAVDLAEKAGERSAVESQEKAGETSAVESQEKAGERSAVESQEKAGERSAVESLEKAESSELSSSVEDKEAVEVDRPSDSTIEQPKSVGEQDEVFRIEKDHVLPTAEGTNTAMADPGKALSDANAMSPQPSESIVQDTEATESLSLPKEKESSEVGSSDSLRVTEAKSGTDEVDLVEARYVADQLQNNVDLCTSTDEQKTLGMALDSVSSLQAEAVESQATVLSDTYDTHHAIIEESKNDTEFSKKDFLDTLPSAELVFQENDVVAKSVEVNQLVNHNETGDKEQRLNSGAISNSADFSAELEKVKKEMKMMETALQGAARQAQAKADEIAKLMNENEQLKAVTEDLRRKSNDAEIELLREEYHQRVATLERKVYALTKERDTLRREQSKKSDAAALLKEKDEIINQVMAEGEELSKKQAAQESQIRKLRAQVRELEEEKKGLTTKLQVEENKVDSIKRDKAATEKLLQETIEKSQAELAAQKEFYTNALSAAKEAEALAEARANDEARTELESRLREAEEREAMLVQALEELRQTLSQKEQQAVFREDMLRRDIEDLQKRYQASERRCEELITQVPESTRPLLRQIEAMQETTARRAEAWAAVERSLNSRLQEAEARAAAAEERERSINERLTQTLSRINVLEAQISCLRTEQTQLTRSLEKERHRAAENRQEYLAAKEEADTQEGRANQLDEEIKELRRKHKQDLQEAIAQQELLQQEIEREKTARLDLERTSRLHSSTVPDQPPLSKQSSAFDNGILPRKLSSASSLSSMEESYFLQASLDSSDGFSDRRTPAETTMSPYYMKSMTPSTFEASLRQKEGELASYMSRLASLESIRDSLAEELVKMTAQCEKLRVEAATLPGMRAELEALRRRHSAALELMGERDEELEELRNDIVDLKEMYREQVNLLVNKIQILSSSMSTT